MATYTVTTLDDTLDDSDGDLSLREALVLANADDVTADTIEFDQTAMGGNTIVLSGSALTILSDVTIDGGTGVTIDADQLSRVLSIAQDSADDTKSRLRP